MEASGLCLMSKIYLTQNEVLKQTNKKRNEINDEMNCLGFY